MSGAVTVTIRHEDGTVSSHITPSRGIQAPFLTDEFRNGDVNPVLAYLARNEGVYAGTPNLKVPIDDGIIVIDIQKKHVINCQSYTALSVVHHFEIGLADLKWGGPHAEDIPNVVRDAKNARVMTKDGWKLIQLPETADADEKMGILRTITNEHQALNGISLIFIEIGFSGWEMVELAHHDLKNLELVRGLIGSFSAFTDEEDAEWETMITELKQEQGEEATTEPAPSILH